LILEIKQVCHPMKTPTHMATQFNSIEPKLQQFIEKQQMFFVATAAPTGRINLSPKGLDSLKIINPNRVAWLNLTGSGNESAAHLMQLNRMTIMFCSFDKNPMILRLYGQAKTLHEGDPEWDELSPHFPTYIGTRQIFDLQVDLVQTSCGYAVPFYEFKGQRETLEKWAEKKGKVGIKEYWEEKNKISLDGFPTDL
jgi:hypothetical protein